MLDEIRLYKQNASKFSIVFWNMKTHDDPSTTSTLNFLKTFGSYNLIRV